MQAVFNSPSEMSTLNGPTTVALSTIHRIRLGFVAKLPAIFVRADPFFNLGECFARADQFS